MIELRSDTFTLPTVEMLKAIAIARLGNDGYHEDPTVNALEQLAARKLGKEAACLMPSGTMANLACILAHSHGKKGAILVGDRSDIYVYEAESAALCKGVEYVPLATVSDGTFRMRDLESAFQEANGLPARDIAAVCIENPHNLSGGVVLPQSYMKTIADFVHSKKVPLHLDGARIFNAAAALNIDAAAIAGFADSIQFCLSKGLAAPIGSMAVGEAKFIERVRGFRKTLGGTMRQAGVIAAAGIVALERMVGRLSEDHRNARRLAKGLKKIPGIKLDLSTVQTNVVVFEIIDKRFTCESFIASARHHGINLCEFKYGRIRAVAHHGTTAEQIDSALEVLVQILTTGPVEHAVYCGEMHQ